VYIQLEGSFSSVRFTTNVRLKLVKRIKFPKGSFLLKQPLDLQMSPLNVGYYFRAVLRVVGLRQFHVSTYAVMGRL